MKKSLSFAAVAVLALAACGRFFLMKDKVDAAKKVAIVQYVINPHILLGYPNAEEAKTEVAAKNVEAFAHEFGNKWQIIPTAELTANPAYMAGGKPALEGWYTAKGLRFFDELGIDDGMLAPDVAKKLCADLGVDAVITLVDSWGMNVSFFRGYTNNVYTVNAFDKDGVKIWTDVTVGRSSENFGVPPGGVVVSDLANWTTCNTQAFASAMVDFKAHLGQ